MTVQDERGGPVGVALRMVNSLIGSQVMWLFDVTESHWTKGKEGYENLCWSYFLYDTAEAHCRYHFILIRTYWRHSSQSEYNQLTCSCNIYKTTMCSDCTHLSPAWFSGLFSVINATYSIPGAARFLSDPSRQKGLKIRHLCHTKLLFISVSLRVPGNVLWILNWHLFVHIASTTRLQLCRDHADNKGSTSAQKKYYFRLNKTFEWAHSAKRWRLALYWQHVGDAILMKNTHLITRG